MTLKLHGKHLIAGEWIAGDETFRSSPYAGEGFDVSRGTVADVDRAVRAAEDAFWTYGHSSREDRAAFLEAIADEIETRAEDITAVGSAETGCPPQGCKGNVAEPPDSCGCLRTISAMMPILTCAMIRPCLTGSPCRGPISAWCNAR